MHVPFIKDQQDGVTIDVRVTPRSSANSIAGLKEDRLVIKLASPPVEGRANKELLKFLGKVLDKAPSSITIVRGGSSREKTLHVAGLDAETARRLLRP